MCKVHWNKNWARFESGQLRYRPSLPKPSNGKPEIESWLLRELQRENELVKTTDDEFHLGSAETLKRVLRKLGVM